MANAPEDQNSSAINVNGVVSPDELELANLPSSRASQGGFTGPDPVASVPNSDERINESSLPPVDKGKQAWLFLLSAFVVEGIVWGFPSSFGVFLEAYLGDPQYSSQPYANSLLPLVGTLTSGVAYCSGPLIMPLCHKYPHLRRKMISAGLVFSVVSLFAASYCQSVPGLVFLQGVLYGTGGFLLYLPTMTFLSEWFVKRRGQANGILFAATGIGGFLLPLVFRSCIAKFGTRSTLRIYAIIIGCLMTPLLPFLKGRLPDAPTRGPMPRSRGPTGFSLWRKNPVAWFVLVVNTLQGLAYFVPILWLPTFGSDLNLSATTSSLALALLNASSVIGSITMGYLSDKHHPWALGISLLAITSLVTFILWGLFSYNLAGLICFALAYGLAAGSWSSLYYSFLHLIAKQDLSLTSNLFGYLSLTRGLGNIISTPIASFLVSGSRLTISSKMKTGFEVAEGRYGSVIIYVGSCFAGAALLGSVGWWIEDGAQGRRETLRGQRAR